jgi:regulator of RNase E activity RraB
VGNVDIQVEVNDSDILRIEKGPYAWMRDQQFKRMNLEEFRKAVIEKFAEVGFVADVLTYNTDGGADVFAFDVVVKERLGGEFDPDRQVHEVVSNILELPDQDKGWIKTDESLRAAEQAMRENPHRH